MKAKKLLEKLVKEVNKYMIAKKQYSKKINRKILGTQERPRLSIFRSNNHIYAQLINDAIGITIGSASTLTNKQIKELSISPSTKAAAFFIGEEIAKIALELNVKNVLFDRGQFIYHGRIKSLADGAKNAGLIF